MKRTLLTLFLLVYIASTAAAHAPWWASSALSEHLIGNLWLSGLGRAPGLIDIAWQSFLPSQTLWIPLLVHAGLLLSFSRRISEFGRGSPFALFLLLRFIFAPMGGETELPLVLLALFWLRWDSSPWWFMAAGTVLVFGSALFAPAQMPEFLGLQGWLKSFIPLQYASMQLLAAIVLIRKIRVWQGPADYSWQLRRALTGS